MAKLDFGKIKGTLKGATDSVKNATSKIINKEPEPVSSSLSDRVKGAMNKNQLDRPDSEERTEEEYVIRNLTVKNAIKIIYYLMAVDGNIFHCEEEKFDSICEELDKDGQVDKDSIITECKQQLDKIMDDDDYYDVVQDGVEEAVLSPDNTETSPVHSKLILWDLLTIAYSDENYDESERKLIKYYVRKMNISKTVFLEMESTILTLMDLEKEIKWAKTTDRSYMEIQKNIDEIKERQNVIMDSIKDLINL